MNLREKCKKTDDGYYLLEEGVAIPVRLFMSETLFNELEDSVFEQIRAATLYPGARDVVITPDAHSGYGVPVGCVIATEDTLCQAPVGYDIGCGMMSFRSTVDKGKALDKKRRLDFSKRVMSTVGLGVGEGGQYQVSVPEFQEIVRTGAAALGYDRGHRSERDFIPVDDSWDIPAKPLQRGISQLRSLGGGNHFIELQHDEDDKLWVMVHTGSRGFGHGLATEYLEHGKRSTTVKGQETFLYPDSPHWSGYKNAVAAGANFAIANRLLIWEAVGKAFEKAFGQEPDLVYEISHNLVQEEEVPNIGKAWVHRKGATRAFPAGHASLEGTPWAETGHPILIPGSMGDTSYVLYAEPGAAKSLYSVNHGCGRRLSRSAARRSFTQEHVNQQMKGLNVMVNAGGDTPIDESPGCYKPSAEVIRAVVDAGLARVAHRLTPIASIKGD